MLKYISFFLISAITLIHFSSCKQDKKGSNNTGNLNPYDRDPCDETLNLVESNPLSAAKAMDICAFFPGSADYGLISAKYIRANGDSIGVNKQFGIMSQFGTMNLPVKGNRFFVMSTGAARTPSQAGACGSQSCFGVGTGSAPPGYPLGVQGCPVSNTINDDVGLQLVLKVPSGATGFSIDHSVFTFDYPELLCNSFNDQFAIIVDPSPSGAVNGNVAFDSLSRPMGVNSAFLNPGNTNILKGTGFDIWNDAASTGWVRTTVPVTGGSTITVKFIIYDLGDQNSDMTVLLDRFHWLQGSVQLKTFRP